MKCRDDGGSEPPDECQVGASRTSRAAKGWIHGGFAGIEPEISGYLGGNEIFVESGP